MYDKGLELQKGRMSEFHGQIMDSKGKIFARGKINNWNGEGIYITP